MRVVSARYGHEALMGYKFRARIVDKKSKYFSFFKFKTYEVTKYRYIIDYYFMSWSIYYKSKWFKSKDEAIKMGNKYLDKYESEISGDYL